MELTSELLSSGRAIILLSSTRMSIVLELRGHQSHTGTPLVHEPSEYLVLSNVFGTLKNLDSALPLSPVAQL